MNEEYYEEERSAFSLRDPLYVVCRHRRAFGMVFLIAALCSIMVFAVAGTKKYYTAEALLLFKVGREDVSIDPMAITGDSPHRGGRTSGDQMRSAIEILRSYDLAQKVVDDIGLDVLIPPDEVLVQKSFWKKLTVKTRDAWEHLYGTFREPEQPPQYYARLEERERLEKAVGFIVQGIQARPVRYSSILNVSFTSKHPKVSHKILETIIDLYLEKHINLHFSDSTYRFLQQKTDELSRNLEDTEQKIKEFKNSSGIAGLEPTSLNERHDEIQQEISHSETSLAISKVRVNLLKKTLSTILVHDDGQVLFGNSAEDFERRIAALRVEEQELLSTFTPESIPVQEVRRQIAELQKLLSVETARETGTGEDSSPASYISLQASDQLQTDLLQEQTNVTTQTERLKILRRQLEAVKSEISRLNEGLIRLGQLERKKNLDASSFQRYAESLEEARIDQALKIEKISNVSIAQPPTYPLLPDKSKARLIIPLGLAGGFVFGLGIAFLKEKLDATVKRPEDVARLLDLRTLASIEDNQEGQVFFPINSLENLAFLPGKQPDARVTGAEAPPPDRLQKAFERLLHRVLLTRRASSKTPFVIAVTSSRVGEGVSMVANNLAFSFARLGNVRVMLVDMKMLNDTDVNSVCTSLARMPDLGNVLAVRSGQHSSALPNQVDQLYMVRSEKGSKQTTVVDLQEVWQDGYDFVVVDMPPLHEDSRTEVLSRIADGVILVIEAERERWQVIHRAKEILEEAESTILGVVLNKRRFYIPELLYKRL